MSDSLSHINQEGRASMVDVSPKTDSKRTARAECKVLLNAEIIALLSDQEIQSAKGPVFQTAILAGIMAAKKTSELIPLCHPLPLDNVDLQISIIDDTEVRIKSTAVTTGKTGVEMEALTGASIAALTIYDMCKALSHDIIISDLKLMEKTGGNRDFKRS